MGFIMKSMAEAHGDRSVMNQLSIDDYLDWIDLFDTYDFAEPSAAIKARVDAARAIQRRRFGQARSNAHMDTKDLRAFCALDEEGDRLMKDAFEALGLSGRSYDRILRVARTIADLAGSEGIGPEHLAEAIQYRSYDCHGNE